VTDLFLLNSRGYAGRLWSALRMAYLVAQESAVLIQALSLAKSLKDLKEVYCALTMFATAAMEFSSLGIQATIVNSSLALALLLRPQALLKI